MKKINRIISLALMLLLVITMVSPTASMAEETMVPTVDLKTAESFALLAGSAITNTGPTLIEGDVGIHSGTAFTGQDQAIITGTVYIADTIALQAKNDMQAAYIAAMALPSASIEAELGGTTLSPGIYGYSSSLGLTGTLTLDGDGNPDSIFIIKAGSTLTTISNSEVKLINGANYKNVYWLVEKSATLGTNSVFVGNILAQESITVTTGANINGKLMAYIGAITLDNNQITNVTTSALTVIKVVEGDVSGITMPTFEINVTGPNEYNVNRTLVQNESFTLNNIEPGTYTITENHSNLDDNWVVIGEVEVDVQESLRKTVTITNKYSSTGFGSLTVEKNVNGDTSNITLPAFEIKVTGPYGFTNTSNVVNQGSYKLENLIPGTYTITENRTGLSSRWAVVSPIEVQVIGNDTHTATITNTYTPPVNSTPVDITPVDITPVDSSPVVSAYGTLTVGKIVSGDPAGLSLQAFEITVTGPGNFSETKNLVHNEVFTWSNLVPGEYTITENRNSLGDGWTVSGEGVVTVNANQTHSAVITNVYTTPVVTIPDDSTPVDVPVIELTNGSLTVQKIVTGNTTGLALPAFEITVTGPEGFITTKTLVHNESFTWVNLVPGEYNITENRTGLNSRWTVSGEGAAEVVANQATMVTITNNYRNVVGIPQTGQTTDYSMAMILSAIALILAGAGVLSVKTRKKYNA